jgi:hypothetical protein
MDFVHAGSELAEVIDYCTYLGLRRWVGTRHVTYGGVSSPVQAWSPPPKAYFVPAAIQAIDLSASAPKASTASAM